MVLVPPVKHRSHVLGSPMSLQDLLHSHWVDLLLKRTALHLKRSVMLPPPCRSSSWIVEEIVGANAEAEKKMIEQTSDEVGKTQQNLNEAQKHSLQWEVEEHEECHEEAQGDAWAHPVVLGVDTRQPTEPTDAIESLLT